MKKKVSPAAKNSAPRAKPSPVRPAREEPGQWISHADLSALTDRLRDAQDTIEAIQSGSVDAVVVKGATGSQVYSLAGADQKYRIYVEQMQEGAITASTDGLVLYCNRRFAEMVDMPLERVIGGPIASHLTGDDWAQLSLVFTEGRDSVKREAVVQRRGSSTLEVHLTASRLPAPDQDIMCIVVTDLTAQKNQLELKLAKDLADRSNRAKDAFLATLSHELRTPLTPVLMAAVDLEKNPALPASIRSDLTMIRRNIELEARLIDDLLDITRIASGKLELRNAAMDVHAAVQSAVAICRAELELKNHQLVFRLNAQATATVGDDVRFQQALWNLVRNAIKFTPAGGVITITTWNMPGPAICVEVRDSGIGFDPRKADRLFERFEQGDRHITREFGGLGLGLSISTSIMQAHGGALRAESRGANQGAAFTVELPLVSHISSSRLSPASSYVATPVPQPVRVRILLVEDHTDTRNILTRFLQLAGNDVTASGTAAEALEIAARDKFDVVVSDLGLPDEGGGLAMMRLLRDRHGLKGIAVSGYGMDEDVAQSRSAGFFHHLTKPFNVARLKALILEVAAAG